MFGPIKKYLTEIRNTLHDILESPPNRSINARLGQQLRIDDEVMKRSGPITIIQNQQVNANIITNVSKTLRAVDKLEESMKTGSIKYDLDQIIEAMLTEGVSWEELRKKIKYKFFLSAYLKSNRSAKEAAKMVGVGRSTISTFLLENKIKTKEIKDG